MADPNAPTLTVKVFRIGRYAGPSVNDPQFETTSSNEEVDLSPSVAAFIVINGSGVIITEDKPKTESKPKSKPKGKGSKPPTADKEAAEKE